MRTLFSVPTSNGQRASIALEECGLDYQIRMVDVQAGEHRSEEMLALNPFGRVPVLQIESGSGSMKTIYGSLAIGQHASAQSGKLLPAAEKSDDFNHWIGVIMTDLMPAFAGRFYLSVLAPEPNEWGIDWYSEIIDRFLGAIDAHLADHQFFLGDQYTLVDVLMYPTTVTSMQGREQELMKFPNLCQWASRIATRDAVVRGMRASS